MSDDDRMQSTSRRRPSWSTVWSADAFRILDHHPTTAETVNLLRTHRTARPVFTARLCQAEPGEGPSGRLIALLRRRLHRWSQHHAGMDLPWEAEIGPGLTIVHGWGLVVSPDARIGSNVTLFHGVTLGRKDTIGSDGERSVGGAPVVGDRVWIGPHAVVVGDVRVGEGSVIGGGAIVTKDVPPRSMVVGNPAKVIATDIHPDCPSPADLSPFEVSDR